MIGSIAHSVTAQILYYIILHPLQKDWQWFKAYRDTAQHKDIIEMFDQAEREKAAQRDSKQKKTRQIMDHGTPVSQALVVGGSPFTDLGLDVVGGEISTEELEGLAGSFNRGEGDEDAAHNSNLIGTEVLEAVQVCKTELTGGSLRTYQKHRQTLQVEVTADIIGRTQFGDLEADGSSSRQDPNPSLRKFKGKGKAVQQKSDGEGGEEQGVSKSTIPKTSVNKDEDDGLVIGLISQCSRSRTHRL